MLLPDLPGVEGRLNERYRQLTVSHLSDAHRVAAGLRLPASVNQPFAATQAAWRFYHNPRISLPQLAGPLIRCARDAAAGDCQEYLLCPIDFCALHYGGHDAKLDRIALAHKQDLGYELLGMLALSDRDGAPLAPLCLELQAADGVHSTRWKEPRPPASRLDRLQGLMRHARCLNLARKPVYLIDREADSVGHYRRWNAEKHLFVVRADEQRLVLHEGRERKLPEVVRRLRRRGAFSEARTVVFKGKPAKQHVAETAVVLHRPARPHRVDRRSGQRRRRNVRGAALPLRLIVSEVRDERGKLLARWLLLSNLPASAATVALWYYWRWRIESYHKLLKGAGQQIECWQQESAAATARRLAVASMAAVVAWRLARDASPEATQMREVLVKLSGRQMKRGKKARGFTEPALLAGLGVLVQALFLLERYSVEHLRALAQHLLPLLPKPRHPPRPRPPTEKEVADV
jgi:hypothetical protein